eukprot:14761004-Alexandrium_andersonii.AAC.1
MRHRFSCLCRDARAHAGTDCAPGTKNKCNARTRGMAAQTAIQHTPQALGMAGAQHAAAERCCMTRV